MSYGVDTPVVTPHQTKENFREIDWADQRGGTVQVLLLFDEVLASQFTFTARQAVVVSHMTA